MEDSVVTALEAVNQIEEHYESFTNPEDMAVCNDFIPDNVFCKDEAVDVIENWITIKEKDDTTKEEPILLTKPLLT